MDFENLSVTEEGGSKFHPSAVGTTSVWNNAKHTMPLTSLHNKTDQQASSSKLEFDKIDPEVASIMSSLSATAATPSPNQLKQSSLAGGNSNSGVLRRDSFYANSDADTESSNPFSSLNKEALSAISAPLGTYNNNLTATASARFQPSNMFGSASIAGHVITKSPVYLSHNSGAAAAAAAGSGGGGGNGHTGSASAHKDNSPTNFLDKFGSVAQRTRDLESDLQQLSLTKTTSENQQYQQSARSSRRPSGINGDLPPAEFVNALGSTSPNSIHESITNVNSRHQSVSDRIDSYQQQQQHRMSFSSEHNSAVLASENGDQPTAAASMKHNIWNPASASTFQPSGQGFAQQPPQFQFLPQQYQGIYNAQLCQFGFQYPPSPGMFPPFGMPSQDLNQQEVLPERRNDVNQSLVNEARKDKSATALENSNEVKSNGNKANGSNGVNNSNGTNFSNGFQGLNSNSSHVPGIGLIDRSLSPYLVPPFNPYGILPSMAFAASPTLRSPQGTPQVALAGDETISLNNHHQQQQPQQQPSINISGLPNESSPMFPAGSNIVQGKGTPSPPQFPQNGLNNNHNNGKITARGYNNKATSPSHNNGNGIRPPRSKNGPLPAYIQRSPLLEEFRNSDPKNYKLSDIYGHGIEFSKDQHGSRFIQAQLESGSTLEEKEVIFNEIREIAFELMTDVFGNYVIQKYFEFGSEVQKKILLEAMEGHLLDLSLQMYGCRVVQRAIEFINIDEQCELIKELSNPADVIRCCKDSNGNHVIQIAIEKTPIEHISFIFEAMKPHLYHLSTNAYGCRVVQKMLEFGRPEDSDFILYSLKNYSKVLILHQFGNYVSQFILEHGKPEDKDSITKLIIDDLLQFSKHKFASNVVEKSIVFGSPDNRKLILAKVLENNNDINNEDVDDNSSLALMVKDPFANYVIQKLIGVNEGTDKQILVTKIRQYLRKLNTTNSYNGKHLASIEKLIALCEGY
ncbi:hypothetical protein PACTADRAFT_80157 [Pachysolen tannophilus NRRL Y-2460]|uniref:Pumilio homology domain family member 3 n=1 Tax=Pachysolen tannophilus NRRL Y-2460 TaxID=669874 RepID=A0A1E4TWH9_PACTA|nr:hypothetical protein PACTADRAFT_80157 [Pachysolen tannophilus NRRL Y-2460]